MNLYDVIQNGGRAPRIGSRVTINDKASDPKKHGLEGVITRYGVAVKLDDGRTVDVSVASVDFLPEQWMT